MSDLLRRSAMESFACPYRFEQIYEKNVPDDSDEARRGRGFHAAAKRYIRRLAETVEESNADLALEALQQAIQEEQIPFHLIAEVRSLFLGWAEDFKLDLEAYLLAEERQSAHGFSWEPDLVYSRTIGDYSELEILDWKTYWKSYTEPEARKAFQGRFYIWQASKIWPGFDRYRFTYEFVRFGHSVSITFSPSDIAEIEDDVHRLYGEIQEAREKQHFPAIPGPHCQFCRLACPVVDDILNRKAMDVVRARSREEAEGIARELLALEQAVKHRRDVLGSWCSVNGPINVRGIQFAHHLIEKRRFSIAAVLAVLEAADIKPQFWVSATALKSYLTTRRYIRVREKLTELAETARSWRFGAKRVGVLEIEDIEDEEGAEDGA